MTGAPAEILAKWPDGRHVSAGDDARAFLFAEALRIGQDPPTVLRLALRDNSAGHTILALLGLTREALKRPAHRPADRQRQDLILGLVDEVSRDDCLSGDELFAEVSNLMANPKLRQKRRLGGNISLAVRGNGYAFAPMTAKSTRNAYRAARKAQARHFFRPIVDDDSMVNPEGNPAS